MSELTLLDICLRFLCLGQLLFFLAWVTVEAIRQQQFGFETFLLCALLVCCAGAVLLTMHYRPPLIVAVRPILLALTDGLPFFFWVYVLLSLSDAQFSMRRLTWIKVGGAVYLVWHFYFFIINEGNGPLHQVLHGVAGLAVFHVIYQCIATWRDDLVDARRRRRAMFLVAACAVLIVYVVSELSSTQFMRSELGSLMGAAVMLFFSLSFGIFCFLGREPTRPMPIFVAAPDKVLTPLEGIATHHQALFQRLSDFIDAQGFTESRLTLSRLAHRLDSKEHRLRNLINQNMGYRNFSSYLNDHRLPLACEWLQNKPDLSVTDIALDLGYGSITSFNRAFKSMYGVPPRDYRAQAIKHAGLDGNF